MHNKDDNIALPAYEPVVSAMTSEGETKEAKRVDQFLKTISIDRLDWRYTKPTSDSESWTLRMAISPTVLTRPGSRIPEQDRLLGFARHVNTLGEQNGRSLGIVVLLSACYVAVKLGIPINTVDSILREVSDLHANSQGALRNKRLAMPRYIFIIDALSLSMGFRAYELPLRSMSAYVRIPLPLLY